MPFPNGLQIGPYRILEQLGQGGMATVYQAYHASLDRYVAIKVLHQAFLEDPSFLARFQREARLVARLEHPNIVPIYDYAEHEGQPYLVMKYIEGETLKARLQRGPLNASEVQTVIETIGAALAYAHKQGILHRDIKPSNVILSKDGSLYLADFGLARIAQSGESTLTTDMILGTPQYISPEQAMAKKDLDAGTDIYSLGVMLYEMTVGRVPFSADTPFSVIHDHIYAPLPLPSTVNPKISPDLERVLLKALAKDRADRYLDVPSLVEAFKQAWTNSASTVAVALPTVGEATPPPSAASQPSAPLTRPVAPESWPTPEAAPVSATGSQPRRKKSRARWIWIAILGSLCLCCGAIFFIVSRPDNLEDPAIPDLPELQITLAASLPTKLPVNVPGQPATPVEMAENEKIDLVSIDLGAAKEQVGKQPENPRARLIYGFALIQNQARLEGYQEIKKSVELSGKNLIFMNNAARALDKADLPLGSALYYLQIAKQTANLRDKQNSPLVNDLRRSVYYGYGEELAPKILSFEEVAQADPGLGLLALARHALSYEPAPEVVQTYLDQLRASQPESPEVQLLQAEFFLTRLKDPAGAQKILAGLLQNPNLPGWVQERAKELQAQAQ